MALPSGTWAGIGQVGQTYEKLFKQMEAAQNERRDVTIGNKRLLDKQILQGVTNGASLRTIFADSGLKTNGEAETIAGWLINPSVYTSNTTWPIPTPTLAQINSVSAWSFFYPDGTSTRAKAFVNYWLDFFFNARYAHGVFTHTDGGSTTLAANSYDLNNTTQAGTNSEAGAISAHNTFYASNDPYDRTSYTATGQGTAQKYKPFYYQGLNIATYDGTDSTSNNLNFDATAISFGSTDYISGEFQMASVYADDEVDGAAYTDENTFPSVKTATGIRSITVLSKEDNGTEVDTHTENTSGWQDTLAVMKTNLTETAADAFNGPPWQTDVTVLGNSYLIGDLGKVTSLFNYSFSDW